MPAKSSRFVRNTVVLTSASKDDPAASRIARRLARTRSVCGPIPPSTIWPEPGSRPSCPATNTSPLATIAWLYGAPWNGAGASSVRMICFAVIFVAPSSLRLSCFSSFGRAARLADGRAERLEDRAQHVLGIFALEDADVDVQPGAVRELLEEGPDDVLAEPADAREVRVGGEHRPLGDLDRGPRERLVGGQPREAAARGRLRVQERIKRLAETASRRGSRLVDRTRRRLERELDPR